MYWVVGSFAIGSLMEQCVYHRGGQLKFALTCLRLLQVLLLLEAVSERYRNGGRPSFDMIPRGCDTNLGSHHVEPDRPRAS